MHREIYLHSGSKELRQKEVKWKKKGYLLNYSLWSQVIFSEDAKDGRHLYWDTTGKALNIETGTSESSWDAQDADVTFPISEMRKLMLYEAKSSVQFPPWGTSLSLHSVSLHPSPSSEPSNSLPSWERTDLGGRVETQARCCHCHLSQQQTL